MKSFVFPALLLTGMCMPILAQSQSNTAIAQYKRNKTESPKVIVLINSAAWCGVCKANGPRVEKNVVSSYMMNPDYQIVVNDLTDDITRAKSNTMLAEAGITDFAASTKSTGMIYFLKAENKKLITSISVAESDAEIKNTFDSCIKKS
ncbi:MAG TPA: hypothetical protein VI603_02695 [Saprospiraceae bacterium]|nr:hypothetical protein [Saprospiraceae bacterium]